MSSPLRRHRPLLGLPASPSEGKAYVAMASREGQEVQEEQVKDSVSSALPKTATPSAPHESSPLPLAPAAPAAKAAPASPEIRIGELVQDATLRLARVASFLLLGTAMSAVIVLVADSRPVVQRLALIEAYQLGPLYLALVMLFLAYHTAGAQLGMVYRPTQIQMPDQKVYRVLDGGPGVSGALILAQDGGSFARYSKAQQAAASLEESMPLFLAHVMAAGFVLPWTALLLSACFGLSRASSAAECAASGISVVRKSGARSHRCGVSLSLFAEGTAAGVCLFVGLAATARELSG
mmetsp:Transcript_100134/g.180657  ORF Transcript_100134/g.180657 Transcript_100134/m.180657 type:complete len:294 (-) Transcript_100134:72-953(-)